jgi:regulator of protease activity HflC (stomatin/prohibitin superfamily)
MEAEIITAALGLLAVGARLQLRRRIVPEGHVGLLYRDGKYQRTLAPGAHWTRSAHTGLTLMDLRERTVTVPGQEVLSRDQVSLKVSLLVTFRVHDAQLALHAVQDHTESLYASAQRSLRAEVAQQDAEALVAGRLTIAARLQERVAAEAAGFGLAVGSVDLKDVMLPAELKRVFTEVLRAKQEGLAALEKARAESAALRSLANAARLVEAQPALMNLRVLQSLTDAGQKANSTFVMGVPFGLTTRNTSENGST